MFICALCGCCSLHPSPFPLRSVALLPDLLDVFLRVPREVQVQRPARLPLGDHGQFGPRDTPHKPCTYYLKGTCTGSPCGYVHPPECQFYETESGCKTGDKCLFAHYKVEEQPSRKPNKSFQNGESDDKGAVAICENCTTIGLCLARHQAVRTSEKNEVSVKHEAKSFGINSTGTIHTVCATSSKCPRK